MGNHRSRIAPTRTFRVLDSETRARYLNQRESYLLRLRLEKLRHEQELILTRLTIAHFQAKSDLIDIKYEEEKRRCMVKNVEQQNRKNSTTSSIISDGTEIESGTDVSEDLAESSKILLHNLNEMMKWEKTQRFAPKIEQSRSTPTNRLTSVSVKDNRMKSVNGTATSVQVKGMTSKNLTGGQRQQRQMSNRPIFSNKK